MPKSRTGPCQQRAELSRLICMARPHHCSHRFPKRRRRRRGGAAARTTNQRSPTRLPSPSVCAFDIFSSRQLVDWDVPPSSRLPPIYKSDLDVRWSVSSQSAAAAPESQSQKKNETAERPRNSRWTAADQQPVVDICCRAVSIASDKKRGVTTTIAAAASAFPFGGRPTPPLGRGWSRLGRPAPTFGGAAKHDGHGPSLFFSFSLSQTCRGESQAPAA